jgi:hypothetical protein
MNESSSNLPENPAEEIKSLKQELQSLRNVMVSALMVLLVFTLALDIYFFHLAADVTARADQAEKIVNNYANVVSPAAAKVWGELLQYSKTHPDFQPIIDKYSPHIVVQPNAKPTPAAKK